MTPSPPLAIYVHWPYCARICPYCDFNVYRPRGADAEALIDTIVADARAHRDRLGARAAATVFLGGGTPSLLEPAQVARLLAGVESAFPFAADIEVTLEANPEDAARFAEYAAAGVTRLSVGVQALRDADLRALGRNHDAAAACAAVEAAASAGLRTSIDLIYARPEQTAAAWREELRAALALPAEHLSLYQLTIETGTAFERAVRRGRITPPPSEAAAVLYDVTQELCEAAGAPAYEVSNHARTPAAQSRHNRLYWEGADWLGLGPGAHGRVPIDGARTATVAARTPRDYAAAVASAGVGWAETETLSPEDAADERLMMGLRLVDGVALAPLEAARGRPFYAAMITQLTAEGLIERHDGRLRVTRTGRLVTDGVARALCLDG